MQLSYQLPITAPDKSIDLSSAWSVPDALTSKALVEALKRGVKIRNIQPGESSTSTRCAQRGAEPGANCWGSVPGFTFNFALSLK